MTAASKRSWTSCGARWAQSASPSSSMTATTSAASWAGQNCPCPRSSLKPPELHPRMALRCTLSLIYPQFAWQCEIHSASAATSAASWAGRSCHCPRSSLEPLRQHSESYSSTPDLHGEVRFTVRLQLQLQYVMCCVKLSLPQEQPEASGTANLNGSQVFPALQYGCFYQRQLHWVAFGQLEIDAPPHDSSL